MLSTAMLPGEIVEFIGKVWKGVFGERAVVRRRKLPQTEEEAYCIDGWLFLVPVQQGLSWDCAVHFTTRLAMGNLPCVRGLQGRRDRYPSLWRALMEAISYEAHQKTHQHVDQAAKEMGYATRTSDLVFGATHEEEAN